MEKHKKRWNLSYDKVIAMKELAQNPDFTIKPANKGGAIVIQDTDKYITECMRQLSDRSHYKRNTCSKQKYQ